MNAIGLLRKPLYFFTPFKSAVSKSFIRLHFNYGDVTYDQPSNATFCSKNESVQYNVVLAITKDSIRNQNQNINIPGLKEKTLQSLTKYSEIKSQNTPMRFSFNLFCVVLVVKVKGVQACPPPADLF